MLVFDKSALQSLSLDDSSWLDNFFLTNITPLFYIETLADLEKEIVKNRTPEQVVGDLANKTPARGSYPNIHHFDLIVQDLLGNKVPMKNYPVIGGGETRLSTEGKVGVHFEQFPEAKAFERWQAGDFLEIERGLAKQWREALSNLTFDLTIGIVKNIVPAGKKFSNLQQIKDFVDIFITGKPKENLYLLFHILGVPEKAQNIILEKWYKEKQPPLHRFAPYAAYVFKVDLFFYLALSQGFIAKEKASNKIDLSYLYYLPFCMVFASNDNLHEKTVPLFSERGQTFVKGIDLKADLKKLDDYYSAFPEDIKAQGMFRFATYPPEDIKSLVSDLWDKYLPIWRTHAAEKKKGDTGLPKDKKLVEHLNDLGGNSIPVDLGRQVTADEADYVMFARSMHVMKGKWRILPPEVDEELKKKSGE